VKPKGAREDIPWNTKNSKQLPKPMKIKDLPSHLQPLLADLDPELEEEKVGVIAALVKEYFKEPDGMNARWITLLGTYD
jgi:hypothetical protein